MKIDISDQGKVIRLLVLEKGEYWLLGESNKQKDGSFSVNIEYGGLAELLLRKKGDKAAHDFWQKILKRFPHGDRYSDCRNKEEVFKIFESVKTNEVVVEFLRLYND